MVTSSLCDLLQGDQGTIEEVRFFYNNGAQAQATYPVTGDKGAGGSPERPFPFTGRFDFTVSTLPITTDGNNVFRITARDKVYGLDGHSLWSATFDLPCDAGPEDEHHEAAKEPAVAEGPQFIGGGSGGELAPYCFVLATEERWEKLTLLADGRQQACFPLQALPEGDGVVPMWPGTSCPAFFTVRPTMQLAPRVPSDAKTISRLASHPEIAALSPKAWFHYGLAQGLGFEGFDLVFDSDHIVIGGARLSKDLRSVRMEVELAGATGRACRAEVAVGPPCEASSAFQTNTSSTSGLLCHFANLYRTSHPLAKEAVSALLMGDPAHMGFKGASISDWREYFLMCMAELLRALVEVSQGESELNQGYYLGRGFADGLRMNVDPKRSARLDEIGKVEFLSQLKKLPFFDPKARGLIASKRPGDLVGGLRRLFGMGS